MRRTAAARLVVASLAIVLAGCGGPGTSIQASPSNAPSAGPSVPPGSPSSAPSLGQSPAPSSVAEASPEPEGCRFVPDDAASTVAQVFPGSAIKVVVADLNLRKKPCTGAKRLATLGNGQVLIVWDQPYGPVSSDGYSWYNVAVAPKSYPFGELPPLPVSPFPVGTETTSGWIAATDGTQAYVAPMPPRCPTTVNLEGIVGMLPAERLACFDGPIVIEGSYGCGGCGGTGGPIGKPAWLADTFEFRQIRVAWTGELGNQPVGLHFKPTGPDAPEEGTLIRATVHVDDAAAQRCSFVWGTEDPPFTVPDAYAIGWCRERFVVDSYEVLGTDPDYPG
jgi:hypothetical protein